MKSVEAWIANNQHEWVLHINHVATEQDLEENHYLEEIGQTIDNVTINVLFCPYCGEKVDERQTNITPSFKHNDFSKW
jgi:hypothetical protein